jgi:hypothetical protein
MLKRYKIIWNKHDMTWRLIELSEQSISYTITTLVTLGATGAVASRMLVRELVQPGIFFLALLYLLILLITISHNFTTNRKRYLLENTQQILDELRDFAMKQGCR